MANKKQIINVKSSPSGLLTIDKISQLNLDATDFGKWYLDFRGQNDIQIGVLGQPTRNIFPRQDYVQIQISKGLFIFKVANQHILVLERTSKPNLGDLIDLPTESNRDIKASIVGISEFGFPVGDGRSSWNVLVEWEMGVKENPKFDDLLGRYEGGVAQSANIAISPGNPHSDPPVTNDFSSFVATELKPDAFVLPRDFDQKYPENADYVIAVIDSGTRAEPCSFRPGQQENYLDLRTIRGRAIPGMKSGIGYNGVNNYKRIPASSRVRIKISDTSSPLTPLIENNRTEEDLTVYAYDDHRGKIGGKGKEVGSHGVHVSGLIRKGLKSDKFGVLPVKAVDLRGHATLFDILCSFDYILYQYDQGINIRVVNLSWVGRMDELGRTLLESKIAELAKRKIWVVAAAGNYGISGMSEDRKLASTSPVDLSDEAHTLYPACFSQRFPNVITVTSISSNRLAQFELEQKRPAQIKPKAKTKKQELAIKQMQKRYANLEDIFDKYELVRTVGISANFSDKFVNIGVYDEPYNNGLTDAALIGSSYATAIVSATLANYLANNPALEPGFSSRDNFIDSCSNYEQSLEGFICRGRMMREGFTYPVAFNDAGVRKKWMVIKR